MSGHLWYFEGNMKRVKNLINVYNSSKSSKRRPSVQETDILRAAVVFLHSAFEEYYRAVIIELLLHSDKPDALSEVSLLGSEHKRQDKFTMADLNQYKDKSVAGLIGDSIKQHMRKVSFNNYNDIANWAKKVDIKISEFSQQSDITDMVARRHRIVHEADSNKVQGSGNHSACPISLQQVEHWCNATKELVQIIDIEYEKTTAP